MSMGLKNTDGQVRGRSGSDAARALAELAELRQLPD